MKSLAPKVIQRVFELKDKFTTNLNKIQKGTLQYKREVRDLKKVGAAAFKGLAVGIAAVGTAAVAAGVGFSALVNRTAEAGDRIDKMSQRLGLSRQGFQELDYILGQNGVSIDSLGNGVKQFSQQLYGLQTGVASSRELFAQLGLGAATAAKSQEDAMKDVIIAFQGMEEGAEKATLAQKLFGRNGQEMLPMLNQSKGSIEELIEKYEKLGSAMSDEAIDNSVRFKDTLADLKLGIAGMFRSLSSPALPKFTMGVQWMIDKIPRVKQIGTDAFNSIRKAIEDNQDKFDSIRNTISGIQQGIVGAFSKNGEGGSALNWFIETGIPKLVTGVSSVLEGVTDTYNFIKNNWNWIAPIVYGIVGGLTAYHLITKSIIIAKYGWTAAQWALNTAMNANPIGLIVLGIGSLIAAGVFLVKNWDDVKLASKLMWNGIVTGVEWGVNAYIKYLNFLIDNSLKGINFLIRQINRIKSEDKQIGELSFGIKQVDFGVAKLNTEGQEFKFRQKNETIITQENQKQNNKIDKLVSSLDANTAATTSNTSAVEKNTLKNRSGMEIADTLVGRIDRYLYDT